MAANLSQLFVGLFNAATGGYANQYNTSQANNLASVVSIVAGQDLSSDTAFVNYALGNLGVPASGAVHDAAFAAVSGLLATQGRGGAVLAAADYLANVAAKDATNQYYGVGQAFVAKVAVADAYTATHAATVSVSQLIAGAAGTGGLAFTTAATDVITLTGTNNQVAATVDTTASKSTLNTGDLLIGGSTDTLNVSAKDDVVAANNAATIKGLGTVNFTLNALTSATHTVDAVTWSVAATNIDKGTALTFKNVAPVTAISKVAITGDLGGVRTVDASIPNVSSTTTADVTYNINAVGTATSPATLALTAAAGNVTLNAAGHITYTSAGATGLLQVNAGGNADITGTAAVASIVNATGDIKVSNLTAAKTVTLNSTSGKISQGAADMAGAATINATAAKTVALSSATATSLNLSATGSSTNPSSFTGAALVSASLSGKGGALYADLSTGITNATLAAITASGTQDVTVKLDAAKVAATLTLTKTTTGAFGVDLEGNGSADFSSLVLDSLKLTSNLGAVAASTLTVANGQVITDASTAALLGATNAVTISGKSYTDTATLVLNDGKFDGNAVSLLLPRDG